MRLSRAYIDQIFKYTKLVTLAGFKTTVSKFMCSILKSIEYAKQTKGAEHLNGSQLESSQDNLIRRFSL